MQEDVDETLSSSVVSDAALRSHSSLSSTYVSQSDSYAPLISPYFTLKMNSVQGTGSSKGKLRLRRDIGVCLNSGL